MDMQRNTYALAAMAMAEAEGCTPECRQALLHIVDCTLGLYHNGECLDFDALAAAIGAGGGNVLAIAALADNAIIRGDGGATGVQDSAILIDDADNVTGVTSLEVDGAAAAPPAVNTLYRDNIVKGWINFSGTGVIAIRDSFNVSGIVDNGVGRYTIIWDTDFANSNFSNTLAYQAGALDAVGQAWPSAVGTTSLRFWDISLGNYVDVATIQVHALGDQ